MKFCSESILILIVNTILTNAYKSYEDFYRDAALRNGPTTSMLVNAIWSETDKKENDDVISKKCYNDVTEFRRGVKAGELWALKMLDASAHLQSGYLEGNLYNYGNYKECIEINNSTNKIKGQHCKVEFSLEKNMRPIKNEKYTAIYHRTTMGICLPSSCSDGQTTFLLKSELRDFLVMECTTKSSLEVNIQPRQYYIMSVLGIIAALIAFGTIYDVFIKDNSCYKRLSRERIFDTPLQLSIRVNGENLFREDENKKSIKCIHGLRFISACGIVVVHRNLMEKQPLTNYFAFDKEITKWYHTFVINAYLFVDVFFLMSGLLVSYIFLNKINNKKWFNPVTLLLHRYIRLTPTLGVVIMILMLFNIFCDGYYCNYESYHQENCEKNWYYTLLYINNWVSVSSKCLSHSWYLTADMQLFVLSFFILFIIIRTDSLKYIFTILTILLIMNISAVFYLSYKHKLKSVPIGRNDFLAMEAAFVYEPFYTRAGPYIIGLGLGTILDKHNKKPFKMNKCSVALGWIVAIVFIISASLGMYPFIQYDFQHNQIKEYIYKAVYRNIWAFGFSWIIYACYTGNGGFVNTFLSCRAFQPLSKLTYCLYLIHPIVQEVLFADLTNPREFTDKSQISIYIGDVVYSLILALILHLAVEAPTLSLERLYTRPNESARLNRLKSNQSDVTVESGT